MGLVYSNITLSNPVLNTIKPIEVNSLVDTGATYLCIPQHVANQLELSELQKREVTLADGTSSLVPYVGPIKVTFENRICFVGAMVFRRSMLVRCNTNGRYGFDSSSKIF